MGKKKTVLLAVIAIATLLVLVVGATYAYFTAQAGEGAGANVNVTTSTTDNLTFSTEGEITISADATNFGKDGNNLSGSAKASATLKANNATNSATESYDVYVYVSKNDFEYTTEDKTAELILSITDPNGNEVTELAGYNYVTVNGVSGFDITTAIGLINLADLYEITTTSTTTHDWNVTLTFINLDSDQNANAGKNFDAELLIGKTSAVNDVCSVGSNLANCLTTLADEKGYAFSNILKHDSSLELGANDNSYRYTGGDYEIADEYKNTYSKIDNELVKAYNVDSDTYQTHIGNGETHYYFLAYDEETQYQNYGDAIAQAVADGYITKNIDNYVCFGSDEEICPVGNLYRIIGVFDNQVKLIKADYITETELGTTAQTTLLSQNYDNSQGDYYLGSAEIIYNYRWNYQKIDGVTMFENDWSQATLKDTLNGSYLTSLGTTWSNKIAYKDWYVGGILYDETENISSLYKRESGENRLKDGDTYICDKYDFAARTMAQDVTCTAENTVVNAQIGLMYPSEYGYAADQSYWNRPILKYSYDSYDAGTQTYEGTNNLIVNHNWMYLGAREFTIIAEITNNVGVVTLDSNGNIANSSAMSSYTTRPTFSLLSTITYQGGSGTETDPIRIS